MKKIAILFIMFMSMAGLTACVNANASDTSNGNLTTIKMELDKDYDDTDPFVNEMLFCVSEDLDTLSAEGTLKMDGENIILEVKNNKTKIVLWSNAWERNDKPEPFTISLEDLKKEDEYVICLTGRKINYAALEITFDSSFVQERAKPLQQFPIAQKETEDEMGKHMHTCYYFHLPEAGAIEIHTINEPAGAAGTRWKKELHIARLNWFCYSYLEYFETSEQQD